MSTTAKQAKPGKVAAPPPAAAAPPIETEKPAPPTYLLRSEAIAMLKKQGGLRELEARKALKQISPAPLPGEWKKWHRLKLLAYAANIRENAEATLAVAGEENED